MGCFLCGRAWEGCLFISLILNNSKNNNKSHDKTQQNTSGLGSIV